MLKDLSVSTLIVSADRSNVAIADPNLIVKTIWSMVNVVKGVELSVTGNVTKD